MSQTDQPANGPQEDTDITLTDAPAEEAAQDGGFSDTSDKEKSKDTTNYDDIFDDDEDEMEDVESSQTSGPSTASTGRITDPEIMRVFYRRLFPFRYLFQWLNHSPVPTNDFGHREFAFTLQNDAYLRYQSFQTADLLRKQCNDMNPSRFEIGPVYSTNPRDRKTLRRAAAFKPISKELVFDIDMTDYDDIRTCCSGTNICHKCWTFITMAIKVTDSALREDFGFKHILWVYSGRRGAHAWVCDKKARELDDNRRKAIVGYLELLKGGDKGGKRVNIRRPLHPHLDRSLRILRTHFETDVLAAQDPWQSPAKASHLLDLLPDKTLNAALRKKWDSAPGRSSMAKWSDIDALAKSGASPNLDTRALKDAKQDIVLEYTYPRLDANVSKHLNHLLKSPFCVHPGTGRVCVPIDARKAESFDPLTVPTVGQLLAEIDGWSRAHAADNATEGGAGGGGSEEDEGPAENANAAGKKLADWEKTGLRPYVEYFRTFVAGLMKDEKSVKREREREKDEEGGDAMEF